MAADPSEVYHSSGHTPGEAKGLLAPLLGLDPEDLAMYALVGITHGNELVYASNLAGTEAIQALVGRAVVEMAQVLGFEKEALADRLRAAGLEPPAAG
jgi:hypothetical protein